MNRPVEPAEGLSPDYGGISRHCEGRRTTRDLRGVFRWRSRCETRGTVDHSSKRGGSGATDRTRWGFELRWCGGWGRFKVGRVVGKRFNLEVRICDPGSLGARPINTSPFRVIYTSSPPPPPPFGCFRFVFFLFQTGVRSAVRNYFKMRWCLALLVCCFLAAVNALSSSGSRLLVVLDDTAEKGIYSTLWSDLEGNSALLDDHELY